MIHDLVTDTREISRTMSCDPSVDIPSLKQKMKGIFKPSPFSIVSPSPEEMEQKQLVKPDEHMRERRLPKIKITPLAGSPLSTHAYAGSTRKNMKQLQVLNSSRNKNECRSNKLDFNLHADIDGNGGENNISIGNNASLAVAVPASSASNSSIHITQQEALDLSYTDSIKGALDETMARTLKKYVALHKRACLGHNTKCLMDIWTDILAYPGLFCALSLAVSKRVSAAGVSADLFLLGLLYSLDAIFLIEMYSLGELVQVLDEIAKPLPREVAAQGQKRIAKTSLSFKVPSPSLVSGSPTARICAWSRPVSSTETLFGARIKQFRCWKRDFFLSEFEKRVNDNDSLITWETVGLSLVQSIYISIQQQQEDAPLCPDRERALSSLVSDLFVFFVQDLDTAKAKAVDLQLSLDRLSAMVNMSSVIATQP